MLKQNFFVNQSRCLNTGLMSVLQINDNLKRDYVSPYVTRHTNSMFET
jgi:hypothetical protein